MHRTTNAFSVLQATAATLGLAIILWSVGLPSLRFAEAANVTSFSDILSDSAPSAEADHEITFTTPTGVLNTQTIVVTFDTDFDTTSVDYTDIDVATTSGQFTLDGDCSTSAMASAAFVGDVLTITMCNGDGGLIAPNGTTTIYIGHNATGGGANEQIGNPAIAASYDIGLTAGSGADTGETVVAIVQTVLVTASVDTFFSFTVDGVAGGQMVNGTTTGATTTATLIPFGALDAGVASTGAQDLSIVTNARNGFTVTVQTDGMLDSATGADIDGFANGTYTASPAPWSAPAGTPGSEETYGHWGLTSDDDDFFPVAQRYVSASSTEPVEIFTHNGPVNGAGDGATRVGYTVEISALQEAATDYQAVLTYVATPVF